ncbi:MAG: potassium transporter TrkA, partial [Chloroflexota bacterium]
QDLLDFDGDEMYFWSSPELVGRKFGDCLALFRTSSLIGIAPADGAPQLNPPMDHVIAADDRLVFVSADDDTIALERAPDGMPRDELMVRREPRPPKPDATLVLGWNSRTAALLVELDKYVAPGSKVTVLADGHGVSAPGEEIEAVGPRLKQLKLEYRHADTTSRAVLDEVTNEGHDHVVVMSYSDYLDEQRADARTLVTLLHLRDIEAQRGESYTIVSEMLDVRNRALAAVTRADDFIVSGKLVSLMMSQLAENPDLRPIFDDMFDEEGSEIYLKPAGDYVALGQPVDLYTVVESARRRGQTCFGYRLVRNAENAELNYGVRMNPDKAEQVTFTEEDRLIVISEE